MTLPRHSASKNKSKRTTGSLNKGWKGLRLNDINKLEQEVSERLKRTPHKFQWEAIRAQLLRKDVLVHAGTGSGKTLIAAGPHGLAATKGLVTFMVSPLIALQEEQVVTFRDEFNLTAIAVNSSHGGCTEEIMTNICKGMWQIVLISPEIILSKRFVKNVLRKPEMGARIFSIVVDEAHVVSHWGAGFRKHYASLGILRALVPKGTPFVAMSATLAPRVRKDVLSKLQYHKTDYIDLNIGNDRPNVSIVVRAIQNAMNTYSDLNFLIPNGIQRPEEIKKTFLYIDQINSQVDIEEQLYNRLPSSFRDQGIIRPYSATFTVEHRTQVMSLFKDGQIRILICTDAAGMGCNIPDIDIVVQWKLPSTVSTFVQRAGRAARGHGRTGLAVLLIEKSVYEADLSRLEEAVSATGKKKAVRQSSTYPKASKKYAIEHGVLRGSFGGMSDNTILKTDTPCDFHSVDEGLYTLAQTGHCRRKVLTAIYANDEPCPTVPCCDLCDPSLLNLTRPGPPTTAKRTAPLKVGLPNEEVRAQLEDWRERVWQRDFKTALFSPSGILGDKTIENLASVGPVLRLIELERVVGSQWPWFGKYGDDLLTTLLQMSIPPVKPKPQAQVRGTKRPVDDCTEGLHNESEDGQGHGPKRKRSRAVKQAVRENPTIVNLPISTPPVTHTTPVPLPIPTTPFPLNYTTPPTHSQHPPMYPYSSYYISPSPSGSGSPSPYGYYTHSPYIHSSHEHLMHPYNIPSTFQPYFPGSPSF